MLKKILLPLLLIAAFGCADEAAVDVVDTEPIAETEPVVTTDSGLDDHDWWTYSDWDTDANQQLTRDEFGTRFEGNFAQWDVDGDGALGPDESADTFWDFFDGNDDNILDENEWNTGVARWDFDGVNWSDWNTWNADANTELTEAEWRQGWNDTVWTTWDADGDGLARRDEIADTFWDFFDGNDDDIVDAGEWGPQG